MNKLMDLLIKKITLRLIDNENDCWLQPSITKFLWFSLLFSNKRIQLFLVIKLHPQATLIVKIWSGISRLHTEPTTGQLIGGAL